MDENIVLNLPFDETKGSTVAYDYSKSRADGTIEGDVRFVEGKNGNAIGFFGNSGRCVVDKPTITSLANNFTMSMWVKNGEVEAGSPNLLIWNLAFSGVNNMVEVEIPAQAGQWHLMALVKRGDQYHFYVDNTFYSTVSHSGTLKGVSLNQDYYGSDMALAAVDDVRFYNAALSQEDLIEEVAGDKNQRILIDGVDLKTMGVYVSMSDGILNRPKMKTPASVSWDNYHGMAVDMNHKFLEAREITLSCFQKADNKLDFIKRIADFQEMFNKKGFNRLVFDIHPTKPLIYNVYCTDAIEVTKEWSDAMMVGTFKLKLIEPEPVKRVLKHIRANTSTKTCRIEINTPKYVNIYWGDGHVDYDIVGNVTVNHDYTENGDYYPVVTGDIDAIESFTTNAIIVWPKI